MGIGRCGPLRLTKQHVQKGHNTQELDIQDQIGRTHKESWTHEFRVLPKRSNGSIPDERRNDRTTMNLLISA
eukprot:scaffold429_cov114-Cylindrotheca_fusiformis.AAC.2